MTRMAKDLVKLIRTVKTMKASQNLIVDVAEIMMTIQDIERKLVTDISLKNYINT